MVSLSVVSVYLHTTVGMFVWLVLRCLFAGYAGYDLFVPVLFVCLVVLCFMGYFVVDCAGGCRVLFRFGLLYWIFWLIDCVLL